MHKYVTYEDKHSMLQIGYSKFVCHVLLLCWNG